MNLTRTQHLTLNLINLTLLCCLAYYVKRNETFLEHTVLQQQEIVAELKKTMADAKAKHLVSLKDMKKVVRESSLDKIEVEKGRVEREIEMKKVPLKYISIYITI